MARVIGQSGRYVSQVAARQLQQLTRQLLISVAVLGLVEGALLSSLSPLGKVSEWLRLALMVGTVAALWRFVKWRLRKLEALDKERMKMRRGVGGEWRVGDRLSNLPDDFFVVNDLTTLSGNLDHVVIGPTGVFVLDAKNWRGVVGSDGNGELTVKGGATEKPIIRQLVSRMMGVRENVRALTPGPDPYYKAVLVFTAAWVEAKWGATGKVHCIRDEQLYDYIVGNNGIPLAQPEVERIARAFAALAHMDKNFTDAAGAAQMKSDTATTQRATSQTVVSASAFAR